jgi:DGQHR domain-containing protein
MENEYVTINCLEIKQPIGKFYIGVMECYDLEFISYVDIRRLENKLRDVETYIGIQRPLSSEREKEIKKYVTIVDATFPTNILIAVSSNHVKFDSQNNRMNIVRDSNVAKVLDGQHRIAGFEGYDRSKDFQIAVAIFVDMELEDQALVFATINQTQTKVHKSLAADLFAFATHRSPQKTAHNIVRALNEKQGSPFYEKIKILGVADDPEKETITQSTFVENLLSYITKDKMIDRDKYKRGDTPSRYMGVDHQKYFLRDLFLDEKDTVIAQIVKDYFTVVRDKWPNSWNKVQGNQILNKSTGFVALMKFFGKVYPSLAQTNKVPSMSDFKIIFDKISYSDNFFTRENYPPGATGISKLYNDFLTKSGL